MRWDVITLATHPSGFPSHLGWHPKFLCGLQSPTESVLVAHFILLYGSCHCLAYIMATHSLYLPPKLSHKLRESRRLGSPQP